jgi:hypothetical protein
MAIGWMSALKIIPWGDVIDAAPGLVKGARKMFARSEQATEQAEFAASGFGGDQVERISQLEANLAQMAEQQQATAKLIETLAEQNARVVQAVELLRVRTRLLMVACVVLAVALGGTVAWLASR